MVNTSIGVEADTLLSPLFPVFLWEIAKDVARSRSHYSVPRFPNRNESDLTLLTEEDKNRLTEQYGIRFATAETMDRELANVSGSLDFRMVLLFFCLLLALTESWLSNHLASR